MTQFTVEEAQSSLPDLIAKALKGEAVIITLSGLPIAQLVPVQGAKRRIQFGSVKGLSWMADDFDAPLEDFEEYMSKETENGNQK